jgi:type III secretion protein R
MDLTQFSPSSALVTVVLLGLAPFVAVMITSFTKIVVVLSLLRNALGVQQTPPNMVINGLAIILTIYIMYPVGTAAIDKIGQIENFGSSSSTLLEGANAAKEPLREFLIKHAETREREFFLKTIKKMVPTEEAEGVTINDFVVIVPAFTVSELTAAFKIGFLLFLPFIIIDLVISNILMAMGMMMLSPTTVSLPFKLLLFVLIDGWMKLSHGLVLTYL